jgi:PEP-CTERM motif
MVAGLAAIVSAAPLHAQNLVTNPGFESGFTGWTNSGNSSCSWGGLVYLDPGTFGYAPAHSGNDAAVFPEYESNCLASMTQTIATQAGGQYVFSFWAGAFGGNPDAFIASFDGTNVFSGALPSEQYQFYTYNVTASSSSTEIRFQGYNTPGVEALDDVAVLATPEPASLTLSATGLLGIFGFVRRRRTGRSA